MVILTKERAGKMDCPLCGSRMELVVKDDTYDCSKVHSFICTDKHRVGCHIHWTAWGLMIEFEYNEKA